jgi:hypothetical protein
MADKIGEIARSWWGVIVAGVTLAATFGVLTAQIASISEAQKINAQNQRVDYAAIALKLDRIAEGLSAVQANAAANDRNIMDLRSRMQVMEARR